MKLPKKLRRAALKAHADGAVGTAFVAAHGDAIQAAAQGSLGRYRELRIGLMRVVESGPEQTEEVAR